MGHKNRCAKRLTVRYRAEDVTLAERTPDFPIYIGVAKRTIVGLRKTKGREAIDMNQHLLRSNSGHRPQLLHFAGVNEQQCTAENPCHLNEIVV